MKPLPERENVLEWGSPPAGKREMLTILSSASP